MKNKKIIFGFLFTSLLTSYNEKISSNLNEIKDNNVITNFKQYI